MIQERLSALRSSMKTNNISAYLVPGTDPHQSEYLPEHWKRREWISGFDGSAGDVVITLDTAGLWTDSRYFIQAEAQLKGSGIDLYKIGVPGQPTIRQFLLQQLKPGDQVGIDPRLISAKQAAGLERFLEKRELLLVYVESNLIDEIWDDQPSFPEEKAFLWKQKYAGETVISRLERIRGKMEEEAADMLVISALDQIAWTFNVRGTDVEFNPVVIGYAIITPDNAMLFVREGKFSSEDSETLSRDVKISSYEEFAKQLSGLSKKAKLVWLDAPTVTKWIANLVNDEDRILLKESPVTLMKACKNQTELEGFRRCHVRDGVAMVRFLHWLENAVPEGGVTEISAADKLLSFRNEQELFQSQSFAPISAYAGHGAIVHYSATKETDADLKPEGIYLIDSGAQYLDGTTDITRTVALGEPTREQKEFYTRVLKGHIDLALCRFPEGTSGIQLDTLARKPLWEVGRNYGHGTGHGIGVFLNVHEGPQAISYYRGLGVALKPGMICSNEPGFYKAGEYGIRIENLVEVAVDDSMSTGDQTFYKFDTATLCPIDTRLIDTSLLTSEEIDYFNAYHTRVQETLSPYLNDEELNWLKEATREI